MKPKSGCELKAREDQDLFPNSPVFVQVTPFLGAEPIIRLQPRKALDLGSQPSDSFHGVVIGNRHNIQASGFGFL